MNSPTIALISAACVFGGALLGLLLRSRLTMLHLSFGLFAPRNATVLLVLLVCALSVSGAIFLILEMNHPLSGFIKVSGAPMLKALEHLGR